MSCVGLALFLTCPDFIGISSNSIRKTQSSYVLPKKTQQLVEGHNVARVATLNQIAKVIKGLWTPWRSERASPVARSSSLTPNRKPFF